MIGRYRLARIGLWSAVRIGCVVSAAAGFFIGIVWGIVFAFFSSLISMAVSGRDPGFGAGAMVVFPILFTLLFGALGSVASFLAALAFNLAAGAFGGLDLEFDGDHGERPAADKTEPTVYGAI
jgi:hypothetical protein